MKRESPSSSSASVRVLLVDDFQPWREAISSRLGMYQQLQLVDEGLNGLEAIQKAQELQPDLILLDVGLPKLNGVEAARRISRVAPSAKIIFLMQDADADVVHAAISNGASGYVLKADARNELVPAIEAVLRGERFVSSQLRSVSSSLAACKGRRQVRTQQTQFWERD